MTNYEHDRMMSCRDYIKYALADASNRSPRDFDRELEVVLDEAIVWCRLLQRPEITMEDVRRADQLSMGHVDWSSKLPLYVAEAVFGVASWQRNVHGRGPGA